MSKYIIEFNEEYAKGFVTFGIDGDEKVICTTRYIDTLEQYTPVDVEKIYDKAYMDGYNKGLKDGKAVNDKGCEGCKWEGDPNTYSPCERCCNCYKNEWTAKEDKIEVGDEVEWTGDKYIVTYINYDIDTSEITDYDLLGDDGSVADHVKKCAFTKTGRHFDIASILEDMRK